MNFKYLYRMFLALATLPALLVVGCGHSEQHAPVLRGRLAFDSDRVAPDKTAIYLVNANGTDLRQLTMVSGVVLHDFSPWFSPDGSFLVFREDNGEQFGDIYRIRPDGSNKTLLTPNTIRITDIDPRVSPDGRRVVFASDRSGNFDIYTMSAIDGSQVRQLTTDPASDTMPTFTPDGRIVFVSNRDGNQEIYLMHSDGSNQTRLTNNDAIDEHPVVNPSGDRIAFDSFRNGVSPHIFTMRLDGSDVRQFADEIGSEPTYSPDGQWIAYATAPGIVARTVATGRLAQITHAEGSISDADPSWGP